MDNLGRDVPKVIYVVGTGKKYAEKLADSTGEKKNRINFVKNDPQNRYAVAYHALSNKYAKDIDHNYQIRNPITDRYWAPLKVNIEGNETWVLVNKASLHKRFGLSYEKINEGVANGNLNELVNERVKDIQRYKVNPEQAKLPRGKFVKEGVKVMLKSDWLGAGMVKNRYKLIAGDPDNRFAVHYKAIVNQPKGNFPPKLSNFEHKYWVPFKVDNNDGSFTWILLNKSSLCKRFGITEGFLNRIIANPLLTGGLDEFIRESLVEAAKSFDELKIEANLYVENSKQITASIESLRRDLRVMLDPAHQAEKQVVLDRYDEFLQETEKPLKDIRALKVEKFKNVSFEPNKGRHFAAWSKITPEEILESTDNFLCDLKNDLQKPLLWFDRYLKDEELHKGKMDGEGKVV